VRAHALLALLSADLYRHLREAAVATAVVEAVLLDLLARPA
jgi:hypothetical protein